MTRLAGAVFSHTAVVSAMTIPYGLNGKEASLLRLSGDQYSVI